MFDFGQFSDFIQVVLVDVTLAGDNAIVVGLAARGLTGRDQKRVIVIGIGIATILRVVLALVATRLLAIVGLTLAGGILLLWVAWKMYRELSAHPQGDTGTARMSVQPQFRQALTKIVLADLSMSLDNVLAVAGTARGHLWILVAGLGLSVALMGFSSTLIAKLIERFSWLSWVGLTIVCYVALSMIYAGTIEVANSSVVRQ